MESYGIPGRLHVSDTTAEALIRSGKESWVTKRPEKIEAKGKGILQTYWVTPNKTETSSALSCLTETRTNNSLPLSQQ